jgi:hypothetical protein
LNAPAARNVPRRGKQEAFKRNKEKEEERKDKMKKEKRE